MPLQEQELEQWFRKSNLTINKFNYQCISSPGTMHSAGVDLLYKPCYQLVKKWQHEAGSFNPCGTLLRSSKLPGRVCTDPIRRMKVLSSLNPFIRP